MAGMPIYYFDSDDGTNRFYDDVGTELADDQAARDEATVAISEMAKDHIPGDGPQKKIQMRVRSALGEPLLHLSVSFAIHPLK